MEDKDLKYNEVLNRLQRAEPVMSDAEGLTDSIMQKVEKMSASAGRIRLMRISGMLSGVAASALICLFAYETLNYPVLPVENLSENTVERMYSIKYNEFYNMEKAEIIEYLSKKMETQRVLKEQLSVAFHNKQQNNKILLIN